LAGLEGESEQNVKFPKRLRHRGKGKVLATIYKRPDGYRLYWRARAADGMRKSYMQDCSTYSKAKRVADKVVADLAKGNRAPALTPGQADSALAALEALENFRLSTGRRVSLRSAVADYCELAGKLHKHGRTPGEAVDGYLSSVATVKRVDLRAAVEQFIAAQEPRTKASDGKRPEISPKYHYNRAIMLRRFAGMFPNTALCDLGKQHLDAFIGGLAETKSKSNRKPVISAKARNHHRTAVRQFLQWAIRKDYLLANHRLGEADGMRLEKGNTSEIEFYTPAEFKALLDGSEGPLRAMVAIGGLAGLRTQELLRLTWEDVRWVENHIEVTAAKAKTRQRRLVEICPALAQWLAPFAEFTGKVWTGYDNLFHKDFVALCAKVQVVVKGKQVAVKRKPNGLRHSFCTFHFALHGSEGLTAQQAGSSPQMLFAHYRGLATKAEGQAWFAVAPAQPANVIQLGSQPNH
jgi:integrase